MSESNQSIQSINPIKKKIEVAGIGSRMGRATIELITNVPFIKINQSMREVCFSFLASFLSMCEIIKGKDGAFKRAIRAVRRTEQDHAHAHHHRHLYPDLDNDDQSIGADSGNPRYHFRQDDVGRLHRLPRLPARHLGQTQRLLFSVRLSFFSFFYWTLAIN